MEIWIIACQAFWLISIAYAANGFAPLMRGKKPLDARKKFGKYRLLGDGKTYEGTFGGMLFGIFIGLILIYFQSDIQKVSANYGFSLPVLNIYMIVLLSVGAIVGDIVGAFIKRRLGIKRGAPAPLLDQLDFITGALLFTSLIYVPSLEIIVFLYIATPIIHWLANILGYIIKVKQTPW